MATDASIINKETDARFWAQTGLKVGHKLDPSNPTDAAFIPVWNQIHAQVIAEDQAGNLHLTYNQPAAQQAIVTAAAADADTAAHLDAAKAATDPATKEAHVQAAAASQGQSAQATAQLQQATKGTAKADPTTVAAASQQAASTPPPPAADSKHHVGHHQATNAGATAAQDHAAPAPPVVPIAHPADLASARGEAPHLAQSTAGDFVGVTRMFSSPTGHAVAFPSHDALVTWYQAAVTNPGAAGSYVAAFDKHDPAWPHPIADGIGGEAPLVVTTDADGHKHGHVHVPHHHLPHPLPPNVTTVAQPDVTAPPPPPPPDVASAPDPWAGTAADAPPSPASSAPSPSPQPPPPSSPQAPAAHQHRPKVPDAPQMATLDQPKTGSSKLGTYIAIGAAALGGAALIWFIMRDSGGSARARLPGPRTPRGSLPSMAPARGRGR